VVRPASGHRPDEWLTAGHVAVAMSDRPRMIRYLYAVPEYFPPARPHGWVDDRCRRSRRIPRRFLDRTPIR